MTARLSRVFEKPEKIFSTSLFAFSWIKRPSRVKNPVCPAEHLNRELAGRVWWKGVVERVLGRFKRRCGEEVVGEGLERSERWAGEAAIPIFLLLCSNLWEWAFSLGTIPFQINYLRRRRRDATTHTF